jgi:hypothetical protein
MAGDLAGSYNLSWSPLGAGRSGCRIHDQITHVEVIRARARAIARRKLGHIEAFRSVS